MAFFDRIRAILQVGSTDVANANPVPVSDAGGALTVDGTVAVTSTDLSTLASAVSATHMQVDVLTMPVGGSGLTDAELRATAVPVSLASSAVQATLAAETTKVIGVTRTADGAGNLLTSTGAALDINIKSGSTGTSGIDGATFTPATTYGNPVMGEYEATPTAVTTGKMGVVGMTANRALRTSIDADGLPALDATTDSVEAFLSAVDNAVLDTIASAVVGGHMQVDILSGASSGGSSAIDDADFTAATTTGTPIMGVYESTPTSVTAGDMGIAGMTATRALRVSIDPDGLPGLDDTTDSVAAVLHGKAVSTDGTDPTSVAEGADATVRTTPDQRMLVCDFSPRLGSYNAEYAAAQTAVALVAAPGAGLSIYITDIMVSNGATAGIVKLVENTTTPVIKVPAMHLGINGGSVMNFKTPIRLTANTNFGLTSTTVTTHSVLVNYFIAP